MGPFDITLTFSKSGDFAGQMMMVDLMSVALSPQHFKNFCQVANATLQAYEKVFGTLQIPDLDTSPGFTAEQLENMLREARNKAAAARAVAASATPPASSSGKKRPSRRSRGAAQG
jgi:hypothetical protein